MNIPESIVEHEPKYKVNAWQDYSLAELGNWVHLLAKRAGMRDDKAKAIKDITDASNYLDMMRVIVDAAMDDIGA